MEPQDQLFNLMAVAEEHQQAVKDAVAALNAERESLAAERTALRNAIEGAQKGVGDAVKASVRESLGEASQTAAKALSEASRPVLGQLTGVVKAAREAESKLTQAVDAFGWRWGIVAGTTAAGAILAVLLVAVLCSWWQLRQVRQLNEQKAALGEEVAQLKAQANDWTKRAGKAKLEKCGDAARVCVRIETTTGYGKDNDYFILKGY